MNKSPCSTRAAEWRRCGELRSYAAAGNCAVAQLRRCGELRSYAAAGNCAVAAAGNCAHCYIGMVCCLLLVRADYIGRIPGRCPEGMGNCSSCFSGPVAEFVIIIESCAREWHRRQRRPCPLGLRPVLNFVGTESRDSSDSMSCHGPEGSLP